MKLIYNHTSWKKVLTTFCFKIYQPKENKILWHVLHYVCVCVSECVCVCGETEGRTLGRSIARTTLLICLTHSRFAIYVSEWGREKLHIYTVPRLPMDQSQGLTSPCTIRSNNIRLRTCGTLLQQCFSLSPRTYLLTAFYSRRVGITLDFSLQGSYSTRFCSASRIYNFVFVIAISVYLKYCIY